MEVVDGAEVTVDVSCPACQEEVAAYSPQPTCITDPEAESVNQNSEAITPVNEELPPFIQEIVAVGKTPTYRYPDCIVSASVCKCHRLVYSFFDRTLRINVCTSQESPSKCKQVLIETCCTYHL